MNEIKKAIDNLKETLRMQKSALRGLPTSYQPKAGLNDDIKATDLAISALENQLNNGWIPVSERLPMQEDGRGVWVLTCATSGLIESNHFCNGRFYDADKNGYKIVAWQPLPETYKEESNDV